MPENNNIKKVLLLVEDEALISLATKMLLEKAGYSVLTKLTGEGAVELIEDGTPVDLVLMDIDLGSGMDGTQAAAAILEKRNLPVIFLTSHSENEMVKKVKGITRYGYVIKNSGDFVLQSSIEMAFELFDAHRRVSENQERYYQLFENIQSAFALHEMVLDENRNPVDYIFLLVNSAFEKMTGLRRENIIGERVTAVLPGIENDPVDWIGRYGRVAVTGVPETFENFAGPLNRHYSVSAYSPRKGSFAVIFNDITEQKSHQKEIEEKEFEFRNLADSGFALIWTSGTDKLCNYFNNPWYRFTGRTPEQELGAGWLEGVHPDDREFCLKTYNDAFDLREKFDMQYRLLNAGGKYRWIRDLGVPNYTRSGEFTGYIGHCFDVTESRNTEDALKESESLSRTLLNSFPETVFLMYPDGEIILANEPAALRLNTESGLLRGKNIYDMIPPEIASTRRKFIDQVLQTGKPVVFEDRRGGISFENHVYPISDSPGKVTRLAVVGIDVTGWKNVENSLMETQEMLNLAQHMARVGSWRYDVGTRAIYWSPEVYSIHDLELKDVPYSNDELIANSIACYDEPGRKLIIESFRNCIESGEPYDLEIPFTTVKGRHLWVRTAGIPVYKGKKIEKLVGHIMDVTEVHVQREELERSEEKFRILTEASANGVFLADHEGRCVYVNGRWCEMTGLGREMSLGSGWMESILDEDREKVNVRWQELTGGKVRDVIQNELELEFRIANGGDVLWVYFTARPYSGLYGKTEGYVCTVTDITARREMEDALRSSEGRFRTIFDLSRIGTVIVGLDKKFIRCNDAFCEFLGYKEEELIGKSIGDITFPEDLEIGMKEMKEMVSGSRETAVFQKRYVKKDGSVVWGEINICLMRDNGKPSVFLPVIVDITERKKADDEIRRQLAEKELILKEVNHRIKNNIASVESLIKLQIHSVKNDEAVSVLQDAVGRIRSVRILYDKLMAVDEYNSASVKNYLETLVDSIFNIFPETGNLKVVKEISDFSFDLKRLFPLGTIVNELITNIMKYAFKGKKSGTVWISLKKQGTHVTLVIRDDGKGLPENFDPSKSTGFGLMLVGILVEQLNGSFSMKSDNGTVSTVEFDE